jgi:signal transduction histidine kinase
MAADMKNQELIVELDKVDSIVVSSCPGLTHPQNIDFVARVGMYYAQRKSSDEILRLFNESPDGDAVLVGDETRLSQVLNNLIRLACHSWVVTYISDNSLSSRI